MTLITQKVKITKCEESHKEKDWIMSDGLLHLLADRMKLSLPAPFRSSFYKHE